MPSLLVRQLDDDLVCRLKERAKQHGRSAEAEHRAILEEALRRGAAEMTGEELLRDLSYGGPFDPDVDFKNLSVDDTPHIPDFS